MEAAFEAVPGILEVVSGYAGGQTENPSYQQVCTGQTGHAEVVKIAYDSEQICLKKLLSLFFTIHDPTTPNRQGNDVGSQYRSIILYKKFVQENEIREFLEEMKGDYDRPIVTELKKLDKFWPAEEYHQHYFDKNPTAAYCQFVVAPKVEKIQNKIKE